MTVETIKQIDRMFNPQSIAIIGASSKPGSFGRMFLEGVIRFGFGTIYPVHPRDTEMLGLKAYPSIKAIPYDVDLAILMTPPGDTLRVVGECAQKKLKGVVIFTAGFGEREAEGKKIEQEMAKLAHENGFRIIGPNSLGIYCPSSKLLMFPLGLMHGISDDSGPVGGFSHSGSFVDFLTYLLSQKGIKFSKIVSCGNECDLNAVDFLEYFNQDDQTKIIIAYLEGMKNGRRFFELAREVSRKKPLIVWKGGLTEVGAKAAFSHTGALAGSKHIWETMFKQAGIVPVRSFEEIVDCLYAFYYLPLPKGKRIAIVAGQGGTVVGTADNCIELGLEIAKLSNTTIEKLVKRLPPVGTTANNPLDIGVASLLDTNIYGDSLKLLDEDENVDMLLAITDPGMPSIQSIIEAAKSLKKPLVVTLFALPELRPAECAFLAQHNIPTYPDAKRAAAALVKFADYADFRSTK